MGRRRFPKSGFFRKMMNASENILMRTLLQRLCLRPREDTAAPAALEDAASPAARTSSTSSQLSQQQPEDALVPASPAQSAAREDVNAQQLVPARPAFDVNHYVKLFGGKKALQSDESAEPQSNCSTSTSSATEQLFDKYKQFFAVPGKIDAEHGGADDDNDDDDGSAYTWQYDEDGCLKQDAAMKSLGNKVLDDKTRRRKIKIKQGKLQVFVKINLGNKF